jgi:DNA-binding transcriptional LysR family regulator
MVMDQEIRASLYEETLAATPLGVACAIDHPLAGRDLVTVDDLAEQDWILLPGSSQTRLAFNQALIQHGQQTVHPVVESESLATNFHTVAASRLLTVAPRSAIALYSRFGIVRELDLDFALSISPLAFICHGVKARLPSVERFRLALVKASQASQSQC